jgi:chitodextrinase
MIRRLLFAAVAAAPLVVVASAAPSGNQGFVVGFSEDRPKWIGAQAVEPAADLGAGAFRVTLQWTPGQTSLSASNVADLDRATAATQGMRLVLTVYGTKADSAPKDATRREEYCGYLRAALTRYPAIRDVIVWNEPNKSLFWQPQLGVDGASTAPAAYAALLARCYDVLHDAFSDVNVIGLALSPTGNDNAGSHSPGAFIRGVGAAYRASERARPLLDTVAHHVYGVTAAERPWRKHVASKVLSQGDWNKLMYNLWLAFDGTAQPLPGSAGVGIWYMEGGSQTAIDAGKQAAYTGSENVAVIPDDAGGEPESPPPSETSNAPDQATQVRDSIRLAACQPHVRAYYNFLLIDEARLEGWQSGAYWADRTPKDSLPAFRQAISEAVAGTVDCDALKGGRPSSDFMPPSAPRDLTTSTPPGPPRVDVSWSASSDDSSAISYRVYRNGAHVATTAATTWTDRGVAAATTYTYTVRAIDAAANLGDAATAVTVTTPAVDTTAPETTITAGPAGAVTATTASFEFASSEAGSRFECALDGAAYAACSSPTSYAGLALGEHRFAVRATDAAGNTDATPAVRTWTITPPADTTPPETTITAGPAGTVTATTASFEFASSEAGSRFECALDGAAYAACSSPTSYAGLALGEHRFAVRATDAAGNTDATPAVRTWTVAAVPDTTPPETAIDSGPSGAVDSPTVSFTFSANEVGALFECAVDATPFAQCASPQSYTGLAEGEHSFAVRARDAAGNADPTSAVRTWTVVRVSAVPPQPPSPAPPPPPLPLAPVEPPEAGAAAPPATRATMRFGTAGPDVLRGTARRDVIRGLGGNDVLYGFAGDDVLYGGRGRDRILAGLGSDVAHAADGARDMIACGPGRDLVYADRADRVGRDCERVRRSRMA